MAWGAVWGPVPVVEPVETVVGDAAAAGLAVVFEVDGWVVVAVVVELSRLLEVELGAGAVVVELASATSAEALRPPSPPQAAPASAAAKTTTTNERPAAEPVPIGVERIGGGGRTPRTPSQASRRLRA
jgi:hypothetical protein